MLIINSASAPGVDYWARTAVHSCWLGHGADLLGLRGEVQTADLRSVLLGRQPGAGPLTARPGLRRRHGWDLVMAAPKSVSLLASGGTALTAARLRTSYRMAVADTVSTLEARAAWVQTGGAQVASEGVVAAAFEHVANDAGQPHLHTHVVLANLGASGPGRWGCLIGNELWRWREGLGAGFQLALRSRLAEAGLGFDWELSPGGQAEIASVPSRARSVASSRSRTLRAGALSFGSVSAAAERAAQARTRAGPEGPHVISTLEGWGPADAARALSEALSRPTPPPLPPVSAAVSRALAARASVFDEADVLVALSETQPSGLDLKEASDWARNWCNNSLPVTTYPRSSNSRSAPRRWTTGLAALLDRKVIDEATEARFAHLAQVSPVLAERELVDLGWPSDVRAAAASLTCGGEGVVVLPRAPWLTQAACIDASRAVWQAAGVDVRVASPSPLSARRWRALTSLRPPDNDGPVTREGKGESPHGGGGRETRPGRPGQRVLVVDAADHLSPATLADLVSRAVATRTKIVLVAGGTQVGNGPSLAHSLDQLAEEFPAPALLQVTSRLPRLQPPAFNRATVVRGIVVQGSLTGADAMAHLVEAQMTRAQMTGAHMTGPRVPAGWPGPAGEPAPPLMVAFGPAEAEALNIAARLVRQRWNVEHASAPESAEVQLGERGYAAGDQVLALRRVGRAQSATSGTVVSVAERSMMVEWRDTSGGWRSEVGPEHAAYVGYGYATTVPYLRASDRTGEALLVLGDPLELGPRSPRAQAAWVTVPGPGLPIFGRGAMAGRYRAAVAELATCWPDEDILERVGPRPLAPLARRRWAEVVVWRALEREMGAGLSNGERGPEPSLPIVTGRPWPSWPRGPSAQLPRL
jgi:conjugative relaxase-like TrwC/TraI family protein